MSYYYDDLGICEVCGDIVSVENDMVECEFGHSFCKDHIIQPKKRDRIMSELEGSGDAVFNDDNYVKTKCCPVCRMYAIPDYLLLKYCASLISPDGSVYMLRSELVKKFKNKKDKFEGVISENVLKKREENKEK